MLRITRLSGDHPTTLRLEGKLLAPWLRELRDACELAIQHGSTNGTAPAVTLDLSGVLFVDAPGVGLLRELIAQGVRVTDPSSFVSELLRGE